MEKTEKYLKSIDGTLKDILKELKKSNDLKIPVNTEITVEKLFYDEETTEKVAEATSDLLRKEL